MSKEGKTRIIEAASRVISLHGIPGATIRHIAKEANMSTGAIYHYYKSKEEILYDIMDESLSVSTKIAETSKLENKNKSELIDEIYENIVARFNKTSENHLEFYLEQEAMLGNKELKEKFKIKYDEWIDRTEELIEKLYGEKNCKLNRAFASLLIGAIDGAVLQLSLGANSASLEDMASVYKFMLTDGIPKFQEILMRSQENSSTVE